MRKSLPLLMLVLVLTLALAIPMMAQLRGQAGPDNSPKVGDMAPDFVVSAGGRGGPASNLKDFQGKKNVILMFFPGAFTPGCTTEFTEAGAQYDKFTALNLEILGISADLGGAQAAFKTSVGAKNNFVSDRDLSIATKYDANNANGAKRYYFLIDQTGKILWKSTNNSLIPTDKLITDITPLLKK